MGRPRLGVDQSRAVAIVPSACPSDRTRATQFSYFHTSRRNLLESPKNGQAALNMARPKTSALVDYEATSSEEDEHSSDLESPDGSPGWPLAASSPRRPRWSSNESLWPSDCPVISSSEQSQLQLREIGQAPDGPSPEVLAVESSSDEEQEVRETTQPSACRQEELEEEDEVEEGGRQTPSAGEDSDSQDEGLAEQDGAAAALPVLVQSSSEEEEKLPAAKRARLQVASRGAQGRGAYALKFRHLTPELRDLLARSRAFFTKPHSLQRPGGPVAMSTYSKAEERILCKFLGCVSLRTHVCVYWRCDDLAS